MRTKLRRFVCMCVHVGARVWILRSFAKKVVEYCEKEGGDLIRWLHCIQDHGHYLEAFASLRALGSPGLLGFEQPEGFGKPMGFEKPMGFGHPQPSCPWGIHMSKLYVYCFTCFFHVIEVQQIRC